jgi:antitoxin MazE
MKAVIQKWGNSNGIRLPKTALHTAKLQEAEQYTHRTLKERLKDYAGAYVSVEYDPSSIGEERFWENE